MMNIKSILVLILYFAYSKQNSMSSQPYRIANIGNNITQILNNLFDGGYDKRVRPNYAGLPVEVGVSMYIIGIKSLSEAQMDFTSDFYFRQRWRDMRLAFEPRPGIDELYVGSEVSDKIWVPDTFFANEKSVQYHVSSTPNSFTRIRSNGEVYLSHRLTVTASCPMNLQYFPMDRQICTIEIESYGYSMADIRYQWGKGDKSVGMSQMVELPQFRIKGLKSIERVEILSTGNYSRLVCEIVFERSWGYYLILAYIPGSLIVIISWVSFWLNRNQISTRIQLGVTTVLAMTLLMWSTNAALPKISYIKSIDVYLGSCFIMVFASLLECATVEYIGKRIAMRKTRSQQLAKITHENRQKSSMESSTDDMAVATTGSPQSVLPIPGSRNLNTLFGVCPRDIDKYSRVVFPVCFLCFNIMYWTIYMNISEFLTEENMES